MSIETTTISTAATKVAETSTSTATSATASNSATNSKSFKDELKTVKAQDVKTASKTAEKTETDKATKASETTKEANIAKSAEEIKNTNAQQNNPKAAAEADTKNQIAGSRNKTSATSLKKDKDEGITDVLDPINELSSKISTINALKKGSISATKGTSSKIDETTDKSAYCQTINLDKKDATFFINMIENQQMSAGNATGAASSIDNNFTEIKNEATQQTVQISQTLIDGLNKASATGKPLRIDFDNNIAVIMKVDKNGTLSANFIPGDAAVENYLRNNIAGLRQSFDDQGLPYNQLSYSQQQKQGQKEKNNKENKNE